MTALPGSNELDTLETMIKNFGEARVTNDDTIEDWTTSYRRAGSSLEIQIMLWAVSC